MKYSLSGAYESICVGGGGAVFVPVPSFTKFSAHISIQPYARSKMTGLHCLCRNLHQSEKDLIIRSSEKHTRKKFSPVSTTLTHLKLKTQPYL